MNSDTDVLFQHRAEELFRSLGDQLSGREVADLRTSIEEGNHAEVIRTIAWIVKKKDRPVSRLAKMKICELSRDLVDLRDMPESFRDMLLEERRLTKPPENNAREVTVIRMAHLRSASPVVQKGSLHARPRVSHR